MRSIYILVGFILLIGITGFWAKRRALTCPKCKSRDVKKTGNSKKIERSRRALIASPLPDKDYEYKCNKCGNKFWSTIEGIFI